MKTVSAETYAAGKVLRQSCPRESHATWKPAAERPDAVKLALAAEEGRLPGLLPLRHGRMATSAFTFYRGSALAMAYDLSSTPSSGVRVQCCGDAHLCNFGAFATPERKVIFSVNDLDETLPAPWEWDVKRLAASFVVGCRDNGIGDSKAQDVVRTCVRTYRESMAEFSQMKTLELWYQAMNADDLVAKIKSSKLRKRGLKRLQKERAKSIAEDIFPKLAEHRDGRPVIREELPLMYHAENTRPGEVAKEVYEAIGRYRESLPHAAQSLLDRFSLRDVAVKVVGVGSVGTRCWVYLFMAADDDPLFLQVKEVRRSVLEPFAGASIFPNHGQRVVDGYRLMQPASDIFLGWAIGVRDHRHYFVRQLRDVKISIRVETFGASEMDVYAGWCGRALALAHSRSGVAVSLSGYMGRSGAFDDAIAAFSVAYADQNERDYQAFKRAVEKGSVKAVFDQD